MFPKHKEVFENLPHGRPPNHCNEYRTELEVGTHIIKIHPYKPPKKFKDEIEKEIKEPLELGLIIPSYGPFVSLVVLVKKKDGALRMCIDYHSLNLKTINNWYQIP